MLIWLQLNQALLFIDDFKKIELFIQFIGNMEFVRKFLAIFVINPVFDDLIRIKEK